MDFNQRVTQIVFDSLLGVGIFLLVAAYPDFFISTVDTMCKQMHLEQLEAKIFWLLGYPAGFKPTKNFAHFLGNFVLIMINKWNEVTSALTQARQFIVFFIAMVGWLGASV